jgi:hypothetical protein
MKILVVGSNKEWAFENHYIKHLVNQEQQISSFPAHDIFYTYYYKNIFNKLIFRIGLSSIYKTINDKLIKLTNSEKFDVLWVFKGMEIFPETLEKIKMASVKIVNFNPDHPFVHTFRGSGNSNVKNSIGCYDLHLCYNLSVKNRIEAEYKIKCEWLPFGYEEAEVKFPTRENEILRGCFIGTPDKYRASTLKQLAESGLPIDLYGQGWEKWVPAHKGMDLSYHPAVYKTDFNKVATKYRLQLNIFRPHNDNSHNMRTFEMPALGCIMLAPESREHSLLFNDSKEAFFYKNEIDLYNKALSILNMDYETALVIRKKAYYRSLDSEYCYRKRAEQVIKIFKTLLKE